MDLAVNVAFPSITAAFALETQAIRWVVVCYVLTYSSLLLAFGRLGDLVGHRRVFRAGLLLGVVAYALCALAPDFESLLVARIVQGVSTALVLSCAPALATMLFEESRRTRALGAYSSLSALASVVAPLIGGVSIVALGWSGVFWFRLPVAALALALLPLLPNLHEPRLGKGGSFDLMGSILLAISLALLLLSPTLMRSDGLIGVALLAAFAGIAGLSAFVFYQRNAAQSILPIAAIRDLDFALTNLASVAVHFVIFAVPLLVPYYLERIAGYTPVTSGAVLALLPAGVLIGSALAATIVRMLDARRTALLGGFVVAIGQFAITLWPTIPTPAPIVVTLMLHGVGIGVFQVAYTDIVVATLPRQDRGVAGALTMLTRTLGVVTAATALTAALHVLESRQLAAGALPKAAFVDAFATVFRYSALLLAAFFAVSCLRRRVWFVERGERK
jgi:MFS family permease